MAVLSQAVLVLESRHETGGENFHISYGVILVA